MFVRGFIFLLTIGGSFVVVADVIAQSVHDDIKGRYRLTLPTGWKWRPEPGDAQGEWFRKIDVGAVGNFAVRVMKLDAGTGPVQMAEHVDQVAREEPGYKRLRDSTMTIAGRQALRREYASFVAGSDDTQKRVEDLFFQNGEFGYWLHFETLAEGFDLFQRDLSQMLQSFVPIAGGQRAAVVGGKTTRLFGLWQKLGDSLQLDIRPDGTYSLGPVSGTYELESNAIILAIANQGAERFLFTFHKLGAGDELRLSGAQLSEPIRYRRVGNGPNLSLIGTWRAKQGQGATLRLTPAGTFTFGKQSGMYRYKGDILVLKQKDGAELLYSVFVEGNVLKLSGGDLTQEVLFERQ